MHLRRATPLVAACLLLTLTACEGDGRAAAPTSSPAPTLSPVAAPLSPAPPVTPTALPTAAPAVEPRASPTRATRTLPRGGTSVFPEHVVVGFYGSGSGPALGVLGEGTPAQAAARLLEVAAPYGPLSGRKVLPAFEFIASVAQRSPGPDGLYTAYQPDAVVQRYLDAARRAKAVLVLDLQPGRGDFLAQAKHFEAFLREPDVGLGLDPEWQLTPGQLPGRQIGRTSAAKVNQVSAYLQRLVQANQLPEKLFVVHQFRTSMISDRRQVVRRPGLATVIHVDGFGSQGSKRETYDALSSKQREYLNGFKLFYDEDTDLMTPREVMALRPRPELITYQ